MIAVSKFSKIFLVPIITAGFLLNVSLTQKATAEEVTYLLPAPPFLPAFGPWMLAQARGYYKAEGLKVKFQTARGPPACDTKHIRKTAAEEFSMGLEVHAPCAHGSAK